MSDNKKMEDRFHETKERAMAQGKPGSKPPPGADDYMLDRQAPESPLDYKDAHGAGILDAIIAVTQLGDGITFSRTQRGDAFSITVMRGGTGKSAYPLSVDDLDALMVHIVERASSM